MTHTKHTLGRALLALAFLAIGGFAHAGTIYHVDVDSTGYTGAGSLEWSFLGLATAAPATATVHGFTGAFGSDGERAGSVTGSFPGPLVFTNDGPNDAWQAVTLGGRFGFDVDLVLPTAAGADTTFAVYLADGMGYLTADAGPVATIELASDLDPAVTANGRFAAVTPVAAVPEPAGWTLAAGGVVLLGWMRRRSGVARKEA